MSARRCPRCGSRELLDIIYGTPENLELRNLWAEGRIMLRRRRATDGKSPGWCCRECGLESAEARARYGGARPL
jgi:hypothetical protein